MGVFTNLWSCIYRQTAVCSFCLEDELISYLRNIMKTTIYAWWRSVAKWKTRMFS